MSGLRGLSSVIANLDREVSKIKKRTKAGLTEAALVVKADSVRITPIQTGNLRGSAFIQVTGVATDNARPSFSSDADRMNQDHSSAVAEGKKIVNKNDDVIRAICAYSAHYAVYVHEMPMLNNFNSGQNKFLLKSFLKNKPRITGIIKKHIKL